MEFDVGARKAGKSLSLGRLGALCRPRVGELCLVTLRVPRGVQDSVELDWVAVESPPKRLALLIG